MQARTVLPPKQMSTMYKAKTSCLCWYVLYYVIHNSKHHTSFFLGKGKKCGGQAVCKKGLQCKQGKCQNDGNPTILVGLFLPLGDLDLSWGLHAWDSSSKISKNSCAHKISRKLLQKCAFHILVCYSGLGGSCGGQRVCRKNLNCKGGKCVKKNGLEYLHSTTIFVVGGSLMMSFGVILFAVKMRNHDKDDYEQVS